MLRKEVLLSYFPKHTHARYQALMRIFSSLDDVWNATVDDFKKTTWDENLIHQFFLWKEGLNEEKIEHILEQEHIHTVVRGDEAYPTLLQDIYDPPLCLFVRGTIPTPNISLAVVGTRALSRYGKYVTELLVHELASAGITIVSGLAFGIDSIAHAATLSAGGKTVAVLGSGINTRHIYPRAHTQLAERILESGGALISEYPPGTLPTKFTFPRRNRIIAGISLGTLVVEAADGSGALITAQCSIDQNREVFTVPQNITSTTAHGPIKLLKMGAHPVSTTQDILEILDVHDIKQYVKNKEIIPDSPTEALLLNYLSREPIHIDELTKLSHLDSPLVTSTLTLMEMKGKIKNLGAMMYVLGY